MGVLFGASVSRSNTKKLLLLSYMRVIKNGFFIPLGPCGIRRPTTGIGGCMGNWYGTRGSDLLGTPDRLVEEDLSVIPGFGKAFDLETGEVLKPWVIELVKRLDSYTRTTPTRRGLKGVHVWA